jgi:hypothetical protein
MTQFRQWAGWAVVVVALLLSPAILVFAPPFTYGFCTDLARSPWLAPTALLTAAALALNAVRRNAVKAQTAKSIT